MSYYDKALKFYHRKFDGFDTEEYLIILAGCSVFLPFFFSLTVVLCILIYLAMKKKFFHIIQIFPHAKLVLAFCILSCVVSFMHKNYLGTVCAIGILAIFLFILFYRSKITSRLFELIVDASCIISLFCFVWALMEYYSIVQTLDYDFFTFEIFDEPAYRVNSTFFNANYYAMMIEFLILMCVYKMMNAKSFHRIIFYIITISCNLMGLYLSGCRTAWVPFLITIPLMFMINNHKRFFAGTMIVFVICGTMLLIDPELFPRTDNFFDYFLTRVDIWQAAFRGILDHPLLGQGPLTYYHTYEQYGGPMTQHAHSVYLDPFLSFGIIGVFLLIPYFYQNGKEIWHLYSQGLDKRLFSLILAFILTVLIHGLLDYTIFWVQTAQIFLFVLSASSIYTNQKKNSSFDTIKRGKN